MAKHWTQEQYLILYEEWTRNLIIHSAYWKKQKKTHTQGKLNNLLVSK